MSRSKTVKILQASFLYHMNPLDDVCCKDDEEMYSHILDDLEEWQDGSFFFKELKQSVNERLMDKWSKK